MLMSKFTATDVSIMKRALKFWVERWDWESEVLFGIGRTEFLSLSEYLPTEVDDMHVFERFGLAALGSLREMLSGACPTSENQVKEVLGVEFREAEGLLHRLSEYGVEA
jgi:hypothetical protein